MFDVVILTDHRYVNPEEIDWYTKQVHAAQYMLE
jgi:hypothetical protein